MWEPNIYERTVKLVKRMITRIRVNFTVMAIVGIFISRWSSQNCQLPLTFCVLLSMNSYKKQRLVYSVV